MVTKKTFKKKLPNVKTQRFRTKAVFSKREIEKYRQRLEQYAISVHKIGHSSAAYLVDECICRFNTSIYGKCDIRPSLYSYLRVLVIRRIKKYKAKRARLRNYHEVRGDENVNEM